MTHYVSRSSNTTKKIGAVLAAEASSHLRRTNQSLVIALVGELGSGKTTFIQGFARGLGIKQRLTSPTFLILKRYYLPKKQKGVKSLLSINKNSLFHIDAYRIKRSRDLNFVDLKKIINNGKCILLIEWADKIKRLMPKSTLWIYFRHGSDEHERLIDFSTKP
ncbi:tRNA (adenosine(37)-N6)-threonylcarbamoyltransferase complex ATPase subunit type 1 TsaE [Candidatus Jorgensenbacteria bacterium]|nr:tRNA (adenosine(37)-N6)-threonylcarbamoyltransferase complex ATPase subunit type 1 TsaE [Candidatus Jorgensenbacteria bacterium]